jgi:hypothetical protein
MDQGVSRPVRWRTAVNRAANAQSQLRHLHRQWATKLEELREELDDLRARRDGMSEELDDALLDLICLQSEYNVWNVPENLSDSRLQGKLFGVQSFGFKALREDVPNLAKFSLEDELESTLESNLEDTVDACFDHLEGTLYEAKEFDLPKGYGRD